MVAGRVYAVGGYDGSAHLNTVECYDPKTNEWRSVPNMASRRSSAGVAVIGDKLYVVGECGNDREELLEEGNGSEGTEKVTVGRNRY